MNILYFIYGLNNGGAETYILNALNHLDLDKYNLSFVIQDRNIRNSRIKQLCIENKISIDIVPPFNKNLYGFIREYKSILVKRKIDVVHIHQNAQINTFAVYVPKYLKIDVIVHSHNTKSNVGLLGNIIHLIHRKISIMDKVERIACGDEAGEWMFGDRTYSVIPNGIDFNTFKFNKIKRVNLRSKYGLEDTFIIGHIGRLVEAKNHTFIVDIFCNYIEKNPNSKLVLIGSGPLKDNICKEIESKRIKQKVIMIDNVPNPEDYYSFFDILLFPSLFEGVPFTLIEAQATGLPILASSVVSKETIYTDLVTQLSLSLPIDSWVNVLEEIRLTTSIENRWEYSQQLKDSLFNIEKSMQQLEAIYERLNNHETNSNSN